VDATTLGIIGQQGAQAAGDNNEVLRDLELGDFLKLMIAELQNQDPLNPMDNSEMLQQISQIREIDASTRLTQTLDAVLLGQNLSSASNMIGKLVRGLADNGSFVIGTVDRVSIDGGAPKLHVGPTTVALKNVSDILPGL